VDDMLNPQTLADDLIEVRQIYSRFYDSLHESDWDKPVKGSPREWDLHETMAHLCALNGAGLECIKQALRGEPYTFTGLDNRYQFNAFNRKGIDDHLAIPMRELWAETLGMLDEAARIARGLRPEQAELTTQMPIYNRPVKLAEALSIIIFHAGLAHTAQIAEPADMPPLWERHSPALRHRMIARTMRCFSLLYRPDIGGSLRGTIVFRADGPDGGVWSVEVAPDHATSREGLVQHPSLTIHLRNTDVFCKMLTGRFDVITGLISGNMKLRGDLGLFLRMSTLLSVDARPKAVTGKEISSTFATRGLI
jgi:hypothetical protein